MNVHVVSERVGIKRKSTRLWRLRNSGHPGAANGFVKPTGIARSARQVSLSAAITSECRPNSVPCAQSVLRIFLPTRGDPAGRPDVCSFFHYR
jgi:hypothetical protein